MDNMCTEGRIEHDRKHLLDIFPEEVWLLIFDQISEPNDKENFSNSSLLFREMVLPQRTQFLFQNVWRIFEREYENNIDIGTVVVGLMLKRLRLFGVRIHRNLSNENEYDLIKEGKYRLRTVCKAWNDGIIHFHENDCTYMREIYEGKLTLERSTRLRIKNAFKESDPDKVNSFLSHFNTTHETGNQNPFFGRNVTLCSFYDRAVNNLLGILTVYGHHIWFCTVEFSDRVGSNFNNFSTCYHTIRTLLEMMPNLKILRLKFEAIDHEMRSDVLEQLETEIRRDPLPTMKYLRALNVSYATTTMPTPIFLELIRRNTHISYLDTSYLREHDIYTVPLPQLHTLRNRLHIESDLEYLSSPPMVKWPLTKLHLGVHFDEFIEWQRIFSAVQNRWGDSLTELAIGMPRAEDREHQRKIFQEGHALQLHLPHLKVLKIILMNFCCLDFLLSSKTSLEHLNIMMIIDGDKNSEFSNLDKLEETSHIKFFSCASRPFESNIWSIFPKLQHIDYSQQVGWRESARVDTEKWSHNRVEWTRKVNNANWIVHQGE